MQQPTSINMFASYIMKHLLQAIISSQTICIFVYCLRKPSILVQMGCKTSDDENCSSQQIMNEVLKIHVCSLHIYYLMEVNQPSRICWILDWCHAFLANSDERNWPIGVRKEITACLWFSDKNEVAKGNFPKPLTFATLEFSWFIYLFFVLQSGKYRCSYPWLLLRFWLDMCRWQSTFCGQRELHQRILCK